MGSRVIRPAVRPMPYPVGPGGAIDVDGNPVDPWAGPTAGDVVDAIGRSVDRMVEAVRPQSTADTRIEPRVDARDVDCADMPDETACNQCALKQGVVGPPKTGRFVNRKNVENYDYQLYIANLKSAPLRFRYQVANRADPERGLMSVDAIFDYLHRGGYSRTVEEWHFNACEFDGFWPSDCTVVEAKGNYQHFLDEDGEPKWPFVEREVFQPWLQQQNTQRGAIQVAQPEGKLHWYFMQEASRRAGVTIAGLDPSICTTLPMPGQSS